MSSNCLEIRNFKDSKHPVQNFRLVVTTLKAAAKGVIEDYPIGVDTNNSKLLREYLPPKLVRKLKADVSSAFKFLEKLDPSQKYRLRHFKPWARKFYQWEKSLLPYHLRLINQNKSPAGPHLYIGLCLHYLLDNLYHLFKSFLRTTAECPWCKHRVGAGTWYLQYDLTLKFFIPGMYKYLKIAQSNYIGTKKPSDQELVEGLIELLGCVETRIMSE